MGIHNVILRVTTIFARERALKTAAIVNLVLEALGTTSYVLTMNSLVFWTGKADAVGNVGGVLDFRWLGVSTVFHLRSNGLEAVYSFLIQLARRAHTRTCNLWVLEFAR